MSGLRPPALDPSTLDGTTGSLYPDPFKAAVGGRVKRRLSPALGLTDFGVNLVELPPGAASALRHWHSHEDEFVMVLSGELTLVTDDGEQVLRAGDCAGFPKNAGDGHCLRNLSQAPATYLEIGSRHGDDRAAYPDVDLAYDKRSGFTRKDGTPY